MTITKTVAIVGAGLCGLGAVKSCLEEGLIPTAFDKRSTIGGMWNYDEDTSPGTSARVYKSLVTNSCTVMFCYSDFPFPKDSPPFVPHPQYLQYLKDYANHFKLKDYIELNTEVVRIEQATDYDVTGKWTVHTRKSGSEEVTGKTYDFVMICSGYFSEPLIPDIPGKDEFKGEIIHSAQYRTSEPFADKNVLVVGESLSAADMAVETSTSANQVYLSIRHGFWVYPRRAAGGWPYDVYIDRRLTVSGVLPIRVLRFFYRRFLERDIDYRVTGIKPDRKLFEENFAVSDAIFTRITCGKIKVRSAIRRFLANGVEFDDGSTLEDIDAVVFGTGYNVRTPFIDDGLVSDDIKTRDLYKYVFPIRLPHHTLACIGLIPPDTGLTPIGEQQSRWSVRVFKGSLTLPPVKQMKEDIDGKDKELCERYGRPKLFVPGVPLTDELSRDIGCYPSLKRLFITDPWLAIKVFFAPVTPFTYRLLGPNAWPGAREAVMTCWDACVSGVNAGGHRKPPPPNHHRWTLYVIFAIAVLAVVVLWK